MASLPPALRGLPTPEEGFGALQPLQQRLGYEFSQPALLRVALTLASWSNENREPPWPSNACLEFFGDAVLDLAAADVLWERFPNADEGALTRLRASLVSERALSDRALDLELGPWLFLGKGDEQRGARTRRSTLADALEAVVGAVFLDARAAEHDPVRTTADLFEHLFSERLQGMNPNDGLDPKSLLQHRVQAALRMTPVYVAEGDPPPPGAPHWRSRVELQFPDGRVRALGHGEGRSLREAEREAARAALENPGWGDVPPETG